MASLVLIPIFGFAFFIHRWGQRSIAASWFFAITFMMSSLYVLGVSGVLYGGSYLLFAAGGLLCLSCFRHRSDCFNFLASFPSLIFILSAILYNHLFSEARYFFWDEFSHWGLLLKDMVLHHELYGARELSTNLWYPPGAPLWQYFLAIHAGFSESHAYFSHFLLLMGATLALYENISWRRSFWLLPIGVLHLFVLANLGHGFNSIYVDHVVSALFVGILLNYLSQEHQPRDLLWYGFPLMALTLVKEIGLYFSMVTVLLLALLFVLQQHRHLRRAWGKALRIKKLFLIFFILLALPWLVHASWQGRQKLLGVPPEVQTIRGLVNRWVEVVPEDEKKSSELIRERFWKVFLHQPLKKSEVSQQFNEFSFSLMSFYSESRQLSTLGYLMLFIVLCLMAYGMHRDTQSKRCVGVVGLYLLIISLIYIGIVYGSYFVGFEKASRIPSYVRYINTAVFPLVLIGGAMFLPLFEKNLFVHRFKFQKSQGLVVERECSQLRRFLTLSVIMVLLMVFETPYLKPLIQPHRQAPLDESSLKQTHEILARIPDESKLLMILPKDDKFLEVKLRYLLYPQKISLKGDSFLAQETHSILENLNKYDYLWLPMRNPEFTRQLQKIWSDKSKPLAQLYQIRSEESKLKLIPQSH